MSDKLHQAVELIICQHSPQYFFQKYLKEAFKYRGFDYEDLEYHTDWYNSQDPVLYLRGSRRTGVSVSTVARLVWELTFKTGHKSAVLGSRKVTGELTHDIMTCIRQLPEWMQPKIESHTKTLSPLKVRTFLSLVNNLAMQFVVAVSTLCILLIFN